MRQDIADRAEKHERVERWVNTAKRTRWEDSDAAAISANRRLTRDSDSLAMLNETPMLRLTTERVRAHLAYLEAQAGDGERATDVTSDDAKRLRNALDTVAHASYMNIPATDTAMAKPVAVYTITGGAATACGALLALTGLAIARLGRVGAIASTALIHRT